MLRVSVRDIAKADIANVKNRTGLNQAIYVSFYRICVFIPILLGISLLTFLLFMLTARG